jgi:HSP20 family protein
MSPGRFTPFPVIPWPVGFRSVPGTTESASPLFEFNLHDEGETIVVSAKIPDIVEEDLELDVSPNMISIRGRSRRRVSYRSAAYFRSERAYGDFQRDIFIPVQVDPAQSEAVYSDGVLTVTLKKAVQNAP